MTSPSAQGTSGQPPGFGPGQFETRSNRRALLEAALLELGADWIILADVRIEIPSGSFATDYLMIHPDRGIALLDRAARRAAASRSVASFRSFLRERGFDAFHPGYLPIVQLDAGVRDSLALGHRIAAAFAAAPPLTINDHDWGEAVSTVLTTPRRDSPTPAPEKREAPIVTKTAARDNPADDATKAKSRVRLRYFAKPPGDKSGSDPGIVKRRNSAVPAAPRTDRSILRADRSTRIESGYAFPVDGARLGSVAGVVVVLGALAVWLIPSETAFDPVVPSLSPSVAMPTVSVAMPTVNVVRPATPSPAASGTASVSLAPDTRPDMGKEQARPKPPPAPVEPPPAAAAIPSKEPAAMPRETPIEAPRIVSPAQNRATPPPSPHTALPRTAMTSPRRPPQDHADSPHTTAAHGATPGYVWAPRLAAARSNHVAPRSARGDLAPPIDAADLPPLDHPLPPPPRP